MIDRLKNAWRALCGEIPRDERRVLVLQREVQRDANGARTGRTTLLRLADIQICAFEMIQQYTGLQELAGPSPDVTYVIFITPEKRN